MSIRNVEASCAIVLSLSFVLLLDATFITIREVDFKTNDDYAKIFITLRNGTGHLRGNTMVDIDAIIYQNVSDGLLVRLHLKTKMRTKYVVMFESSVDVCSLDNAETDDLLINMMVSEMEKHGNYMVRNFHIDTKNKLIKFAPPGEHSVAIDLRHKAKEGAIAIPVFDMEFFASIVQ
uniref:Putative 17.3 kDa secreted salivary protein n=1 Tax=Aedes aegypti TaxID=7159 RepID=Q1HRG1_AEDAE|nr:putative 17.3 kDa secreted salivary protein [Aedes aegypti]